MRSPLEKNPDPICSVDRARELGLNLKLVGTCAPKSPGIRGCSLWSSCRFNQKRLGGFKGTRPHLLGYFFRALTGQAKVDICSCTYFVRAMQPQMDQGNILRQQGKPHQVVKVVAQEGEKVKVKRSPQTVNAKGERVTEHKVVEVEVPRFPDPTAMDDYMEYERDIMRAFDDGEDEDATVSLSVDEDDIPEQLSGRKTSKA